MKYILILFFITLTKSIQPNQDRSIIIPPRREYYLTSKNTSRYAYFKFNKHRDSYLFNKNSRPYNLSNDDILKIEKIIIKRVEVYNRTAYNSTIKEPEKYYKQFIAIVNTNGEKEVWINCCCSVQNTWKNQIQMVDDGGTCYFQLKVNLTKNILYYFVVNGSA